MTYQDFETYLRETEPDKRARGENWAVAIGLQAVDGLKPSNYWEIANDVFRDNAWYFRNALVRANYNNYPKNIVATSEGLERFFRNLLLHETAALRNRDLHVCATAQKIGTTPKTAQKTDTTQKTATGLTMIQTAMLELMRAYPTISRRELSQRIKNSSVDGIKYNLKVLQERGLLLRVGAARGGHWEVMN